MCFLDCSKWDLRYVVSAYGNQQLICNGYKYSLKYKNRANKRQHWRCSTKSSRGCPGLLVTLDGAVVRLKHQHDHDPPYKTLGELDTVDYNINDVLAML